jgi:hypothetical protein
MTEIIPYTTKNAAIESLDNGGRFYDLRSKAKDGKITQAELGKVGRIFNDKQQMILFLEMALVNLSAPDKKAVITAFDAELKVILKNYKSQFLLPDEANSKGIISSNAIITGIPKLLDSKSDFNGFIMFPMMAGSVTTIMMIPMIEQYDVYELRNNETSESFFIAHSRDSHKLPNREITIGGVIKELNTDEKGTRDKKKFLEVIYYIDAN